MGKGFPFSYRLVTLNLAMFPILRLCAISILFAILVATTACSDSHPTYPWNLKDRSIPAFQIIDTDNPVAEQFSITYTVEVCVAKNCSREDIKIISEKIIEGLPKHNAVLIFFFADPSERGKGYTVARTIWGAESGVHDDSMPVAGDYSKNMMRIAMKGEELPGQAVEKF